MRISGICCGLWMARADMESAHRSPIVASDGRHVPGRISSVKRGGATLVDMMGSRLHQLMQERGAAGGARADNRVESMARANVARPGS